MEIRRVTPGRAVWAILIITALLGGLYVKSAGASFELLPPHRWGFSSPRTISLVSCGPDGNSNIPIARTTTVGCLEIWTPAN